LQDICGLSGSDADNVRRAIGRKQLDRLQDALPQIFEGYCSKSNKPRETAVEEAKVFLKIIEDSSNYMFGFNHSTGYSMIGYICAMLRYYYPAEFVAAYFNNADNEEDINNGNELARLKGIDINPIKFRHSKGEYFVDQETKNIYKGIASVKFLNSQIADELYELRNNKYNTFTDLLIDISKTTVNSRQLNILIELDFFSEFGDINKLKYITEYYNKIADKRNIKKDTAINLGLDLEIIEKYTDKITDKTYMGVQSVNIIKYYESISPINTTTLKDRIDYQIEHLGTLTIKDKSYQGVIVVLETNTTYSPRLKVYALANGNTFDVKINKKLFSKHVLNKKDIVIVNKQKSKPKSTMGEDGNWHPIEGTSEWWLEDYKVINL
jgi:DNA polymerase-3 subunit alpha